MSTPAAPVLIVTADKDSYKPGEEMKVTAETLVPVKNTITVSSTDPATGTTVTGQVEVVVNVPATGVQYGISDTLGTSFAQSESAGVFTATVAAPPSA
jgi:uncharacterized protein YfaS (alpha-2-macroglobulin family)